MLIALEGLEGVGKTTLGKLVAERIGATYIKSPPPEMNPVRGFIAETLSPGANFYFYLAGLCALQADIEANLLKGAVIVDRYIDSTIAYHRFGRDFDAPRFEESLIRSPDMTLVVTCPEEVRADRIAARGLHIFERHAANEEAIAVYLLKRADLVFDNVADLNTSITKLSALLSERLRKNV